MDIKIGFSDSPRELVINSNEEQEAVAQNISEALSSDSGVTTLRDNQGRLYIVRNSRIAYVELGTSTQRTVGFAGA